jgi:cobalt/nickel transport protein
MRLWQRNLLLGILVVVLAAVPLFFLRGAEWKGADDRGMSAISEVDATFQPWFGHVFDPSALGIERYMFGLQTLIGSAVVTFAIGWLAGRRRVQAGGDAPGAAPGRELAVARAVAVAAVAVFLLLFVPRPQSGELQDLVTSLQALCVGYFAFFLGYPLGQKAAPAGASPARPTRPAPLDPRLR